MDKQRLTLFLNPETVKKAKIQALKEEISLSKFIDKVVEEYIKNRMEEEARKAEEEAFKALIK